MSRGVAGIASKQDSEAAQIALDLRACPLFRSLAPEELMAFAHLCRRRKIEPEEQRRPLEGLNDRMVIVAGGVFESIHLPSGGRNEQSRSSGVVFAELKRGDFWGDHFFLGDWRLNYDRFRLRSLGEGRLILVHRDRFRSFLEDRREVQQAMLDQIVARAADQARRLGEAEARVTGVDWVLQRIEDLARFMGNSGDGSSESIQRRFRLDRMPPLVNSTTRIAVIEQAYLKSSDEEEDRIRNVDGAVFTRTTKYGSGLQRRAFERSITADEYGMLAEKHRLGRRISKRRHFLEPIASAKSLYVDEFQDTLVGLVIAEVEFANINDAASFQMPDWLSELGVNEVTADKRYGNRTLALQGIPAELEMIKS